MIEPTVWERVVAARRLNERLDKLERDQRATKPATYTTDQITARAIACRVKREARKP